MVIAIDGPSGVGKTTVSRAVAEQLDLPYLDTGATYRAAAIVAIRAGVDLHDPAAVTDAVAGARIWFDDGRVTIDGVDVGHEVRSPEVTAASSIVATIPEVRALLVAMHRSWVADRGGSAVVEGRDIGTVVFPGAPVKVFLTARQEVRAVRRAGDAEAAGKPAARIAAELGERDARDSSRAASPLERADDAVVVDTSDLEIDEVVAEIIRLVYRTERRRKLGPV